MVDEKCEKAVRATLHCDGDAFVATRRLTPDWQKESIYHEWSANNWDCDCNRSALIKETHPSFPKLGCGERIVVSRLEFRDLDGVWSDIAWP